MRRATSSEAAADADELAPVGECWGVSRSPRRLPGDPSVEHPEHRRGQTSASSMTNYCLRHSDWESVKYQVLKA